MIFYVAECEERLGYKFKDKNLLRKCFTHSSYSNEHTKSENNERLEFFGDSILGFITAEYLFSEFPEKDEGELTEYKQSLVSGKPLSEAVVREGLDGFILYGEGAKRAKKKDSANENLYEAIVAGIFLDGGLDEAEKFVKRTLFAKTPVRSGKEEKDLPCANPKSELQEYVQKYRLGDIKYAEKSRSGPDHKPIFEMSVSLGGKVISTGKGGSKSEGEKAAARAALGKLAAAKN